MSRNQTTLGRRNSGLETATAEHSASIVVEPEQCPTCVELRALNEALEGNVQETNLSDGNRKKRFSNLQCPRCAELEETRGALEQRVSTLMAEASSREEVMASVLESVTSPMPVPLHLHYNGR